MFIVCFRDVRVFEAFRPPEPVMEMATLRQVVFDEGEIAERYYFSERAVAGMRAAKKEMNKGRAQRLDGPCGTVGAHLSKVSLNSTDPVLCLNGRYRRSRRVRSRESSRSPIRSAWLGRRCGSIAPWGTRSLPCCHGTS